MFKSLLLVISIFFLQACIPNPGLRTAPNTIDLLRSEINYLLTDPNLGNAYIGVYVESLDDGKVLFRQNEHKLFVPASNMKLYTTAVGLSYLGASYKYRTLVGMDGSLENGGVNGNLIIKGSGDPTISGRFYDGDMLAIFHNWADSLKQAGVHTISGDLIADNSFFENDILADGWNWDDEPYWYSAQPSALSYNDNCVDFTIFPGTETGGAVQVQQAPDIAYLDIVNTAKTSAADSLPKLKITRDRAKNLVRISGTLPLGGKNIKESISVEKPAEFFIRTLRNVLSENGITIEGVNHVSSKQTVLSDTLFTHTSPPLSEIISVINKKSHNLYAEQLLKTMGKLKAEEGSFKSGANVVSKRVNSFAIAPDEFMMVDGSGLSRKNFVSPYASATLLKKMYLHPEFEYYYDSLPIAGVDGTLENRMKGSAAQGKVRAKTGYVRHMRALSGYVYDRTGTPYVFSIMVNNYTVPTAYVNALQDKICILISNYN